MSYNHNPVDSPAAFGFEFVTSGDLAEPSYGFSVFAVLRRDDGYYLSTDSGCSCPTPWESHIAEDFTGPLTAEQVREEVTSLWDHESTYDKVPFDEIANALQPVR